MNYMQCATEFRTGLMNVPPIIYPLHEFVNEDESVFLTISSYDADAADSVQHFVFANPQSGSLYQVTTSGTKGNLIDASFTPVSISHPQARILYIPRQNYFGNDSFHVQAIDDKGGKSGVENIQITIAPLPDPPVPQSMEIYLDEDTSAVQPSFKPLFRLQRGRSRSNLNKQFQDYNSCATLIRFFIPH
ncbi:hypothetical protein BKA69DRAFT_1086355 [Paraphysoderma sedebokerense]|nr:hypothetical protein BKA69DRAFT_1086355 [Paraphysoderma sedebokerense]